MDSAAFINKWTLQQNGAQSQRIPSRPAYCSLQETISPYLRRDVSPSLSAQQRRFKSGGLRRLGRYVTAGLTDHGRKFDTIYRLKQVFVGYCSCAQRLRASASVKWRRRLSSIRMVDPRSLTVIIVHKIILIADVVDSGAEGPGCRVTVLGKLFTPIVPLFTKQRHW